MQSKDPVKIITVRTTAFEADESQGDAISETTLAAPGIADFSLKSKFSILELILFTNHDCDNN